MSHDALYWISLVGVVFGAINGALAQFGFDIIRRFLTFSSYAVTGAYLVIGLLGVYMLYAAFQR